LEEGLEIAKELMIGLLERIGVKKEVEGFSKEGNVYIEIRGDQEGILIGRHGRTLDSLQMLINRMVNKRLEKPVKVVLDIDDYRKRRADSLTKMAVRLGEKAKRTGHAVTFGPFNAHDRRSIHIALKEDLSLRTESLGEGETKRITIIPKRQERERIGPFE
jgi:spoIIIJ-associated protein